MSLKNDIAGLVDSGVARLRAEEGLAVSEKNRIIDTLEAVRGAAASLPEAAPAQVVEVAPAVEPAPVVAESVAPVEAAVVEAPEAPVEAPAAEAVPAAEPTV